MLSMSIKGPNDTFLSAALSRVSGSCMDLELRRLHPERRKMGTKEIFAASLRSITILGADQHPKTILQMINGKILECNRSFQPYLYIAITSNMMLRNS